MKALPLITCGLSLIAAGWFAFHPSLSYWWVFAALFALLGLTMAVPSSAKSSPVIVGLYGFIWTREDFCRGWLITGDTGSGKTRSGITPLLYQVFKNDPKWGGLCIDDKGIYWETLSQMAAHFGRKEDLILLQVRPENAARDWKPLHTFNSVSDRSIPFTTYAKFVVDTATSSGQIGDKGFFKAQAQMHIAAGLEALAEIGEEVSLSEAYHLLLNNDRIEELLQNLKDGLSTERSRALIEHFEDRYRNQPPEQFGGVKETIANYLQYFVTPDVAEIFCASANTFQLSDIDQGKIICVVMPQRYQTERRYVNTFLKMLFYAHVLRRFDKPAEQRLRDNLLVLWADEAQRFVTASEDGMSDFNTIDVIREAGAAVVAAAQSVTSFVPPLGKEKAQVLLLNLRNRLIFKAADEDGAKESAEFLGSRKVVKRSWGFSGGVRSRHFHEEEEYRLKPWQLRSLKKHECVLVHCEKGFKKVRIPPIEPDGQVSPWFKAS